MKITICWMILSLFTGWPATAGSGQSGVAAPARDSLTLAYVANSGVLVASGGHKVLIDAFFGRPNPEYRAPEPAVLDKIMRGEAPFDGVDLVLVTHNHPDHFEAKLAIRYLQAFPEISLLAPSDVVAELEKTAAADWPRLAPRVKPVSLPAGTAAKFGLNGIPVTAFRTLHSGDREEPPNVMYLFEPGAWRLFHEGDAPLSVFQNDRFGLSGKPVDLALVHYWFPFQPDTARFLQEVMVPGHIALTHLPVRLESDIPGKLEQVRNYYRDIFTLLPGMPAKTFHDSRPAGNGSPAAAGPASGESFFGQSPPGPEPVPFLPDILTADKCPHGQLAFTPDGNTVLWSAMLADGPEQTIFFSTREGAGYSRPAIAPFAAASGNGGPAFIPGGHRLFFNVQLPKDGDSTSLPTAIYSTEWSGTVWTQPLPVEATVDNRMTKGQVSVARNGNLYFSGRVYSERAPAIYRCRYVDGRYQPPEKLAGPVSSLPVVVDPWVDPEERFLLVSCPPENGSPGRTDIGLSIRLPDGGWSLPVRLGGGVNTPAFERFACLSPDGKYLFFIRSTSEMFVGKEARFYWCRADAVENCLRTAAGHGQTVKAGDTAQLEINQEEIDANQLQPPGRVMDAAGIKPGMVVGELGAGKGRYTVHLAVRVGEGGKVYANDIDGESLAFLRQRCGRQGFRNIELITGRPDDPLFPEHALDLVFMTWVYHHLEQPVAILRKLAASLKPGGTVVIVDPDPVKNGRGRSRENRSPEQLEKEANEAGFEIVRTETFLKLDNIFILRPKLR